MSRALERRENCGCGVPAKKLERRQNRGGAVERTRVAAPYEHQRGFWDFDELDFGWMMGAGIVITVVAMVEAAKAAKAAVNQSSRT